MQAMKNLHPFLVSLCIVTMLTTSCRAGTHLAGDGHDASPTAAVAASDIAPTGNMTVPRSGHTATLLPDGQVLIAGGMERNGVFYDSAELYNPATGSFAAVRGRMSTRRVGHIATLLPSGKVLIAGGWGGNGVLASAELYDPATRAFIQTGSMNVGRGDFTATLLQNGRVLVAGGEDESDHALSSAEIYDPASGKFIRTGSMTAARTMHTAVTLPNGKVLVAGGGEYQHPLASAELYDSTSGTFTATGSMSVPRYKQAAMLLPDGTVLVVGGSDGRDWQGRHASAEVYNPARGAFSTIGNMNTARFKLPDAVALLRNGRVLVAGGGERVEIYNPATRSFSLSAGRMDAARFYSTASLLTDGRVLIAGGYDNHSLASARAWVYKT
jgi:hypothetical protein